MALRPCLQDQCLGAQVFEVEGELVHPVGGVERCRRGVRGRAEEGRRHLRPVGEHDRHPVARADACAGERIAGAPDLLAEPAISQRLALRRRDGNVVAPAPFQQRVDIRSAQT